MSAARLSRRREHAAVLILLLLLLVIGVRLLTQPRAPTAYHQSAGATSSSLPARAAPAPALPSTRTLPGAGGLSVSAPIGGIYAVSSPSVYLEFDGNDAGGAPNVWYDLVDDPAKTRNQAAKGTSQLGVDNAANYPLVDSWFSSASDGTWYHTAGPAQLLELTEQAPDHVVLHTISGYFAADQPALAYGGDPTVERWWTVYTDGTVFISQTIHLRAPLDHQGFSAWSLNTNNLPEDWHGASVAGHGDLFWPVHTDYSGQVSGAWMVQYGTGDSTLSSAAALLDVSSLATPVPPGMTRAIVATGPRNRAASHLAPRSPTGTLDAGDYSSVAWLRLTRGVNDKPGSPLEAGAFGANGDADLRHPGVSVGAGTVATTDDFPARASLTGGYNPASGRIVLAAQSNHVELTEQLDAATPVRIAPRFKITGWTGDVPVVLWGGVSLTSGSDYSYSIDAAEGVLYLQLDFDVVASNPAAGQRASATLDVFALPAQVIA